MKMIPYGKQQLDRSDIEEVIKVLESDWITQGPKIQDFEEKLSRVTGAKYAVAVSSGTAALHLACLAAGVTEGDEVITSPLSFVASSNCALYCGARIKFADVDYDSANIDPQSIQNNLTNKTKAIIPVHFAGLPADIVFINKIAKENNSIVIEDACHAIGAEYQHEGQWIKVGACEHSDMCVFSFHPVKNITTGEGGVITTNNKGYADKLKTLRMHGITKTSEMNETEGAWFYEMRDLGFNYRITDIQCALGISQLKKLNDFLKKRGEIAQRYDKAFDECKEIVKVPYQSDNLKSAHHLYTLRIKFEELGLTKKDFLNTLKESGVGTQVHYIPIYWHPYYQQLGFKKGTCPIAEKIYGEIFSIPMFQSLSETDQAYVIETITQNIQMIPAKDAGLIRSNDLCRENAP